jgi:molecular chaperone DnaJ
VCRGEGRTITDPCKDCSGTGTIQKNGELTVRVPKGIEDGQTLRIPGRGQAGARGGPPGNLYVVLRVKDDPRFVRDEFHLHSKLKVSMYQAALGCTLKAETVDDEKEVEIAPGTQPGEVIVLRGAGIPVLGGRGRGDHHVHVEVVVPTELAEEEATALREIAEARGEQVDPEKSGFLAGLRRRRRKRG